MTGRSLRPTLRVSSSDITQLLPRPVGLNRLSAPRSFVDGVEAVAAADAIPVGVEDPVLAAHAARAAPAAIVLQAAAHEVRLLHVGADLVELPDRADVVHELPVLRLVVADVEAAVVTDH